LFKNGAHTTKKGYFKHKGKSVNVLVFVFVFLENNFSVSLQSHALRVVKGE